MDAGLMLVCPGRKWKWSKAEPHAGGSSVRHRIVKQVEGEPHRAISAPGVCAGVRVVALHPTVALCSTSDAYYQKHPRQALQQGSRTRTATFSPRSTQQCCAAVTQRWSHAQAGSQIISAESVGLSCAAGVTLGIFSTSMRPGTVTQSPSNASKRFMSIVPGFSGDLHSCWKSEQWGCMPFSH